MVLDWLVGFEKGQDAILIAAPPSIMLLEPEPKSRMDEVDQQVIGYPSRTRFPTQPNPTPLQFFASLMSGTPLPGRGISSRGWHPSRPFAYGNAHALWHDCHSLACCTSVSGDFGCGLQIPSRILCLHTIARGLSRVRSAVASGRVLPARERSKEGFKTPQT